MSRLGLAGLIALACFAIGFGVAREVMDRPGPLPAAADIVVPRGAVSEVATALQAHHVIRSVWLFRLAVRTTARRGPLHAAELAFPEHASLRQVLAVLRVTPPVQHALTIPEGLTAQQIAALVNAAPAATGHVAPPPEGGVLPQTYDYTYGTARSALLARAAEAMRHALAKAWADRAPDLPLSSPREALILASIVERETALPAERPRVAAVYLNRLRRGMRLQADPTVIYAASGGAGELDHPLTRSELDSDAPYNTYRHSGLPPGPICSPGLASIEAVLHPADSDDLYFVADGTGGHVFARTLAEQDRHVAVWRAHEAATRAGDPPGNAGAGKR